MQAKRAEPCGSGSVPTFTRLSRKLLPVSHAREPADADAGTRGMDARRRRSSRVDRWLREIGEAERQAAPLDFSEVALLGRQSGDICHEVPAAGKGPPGVTNGFQPQQMVNGGCAAVKLHGGPAGEVPLPSHAPAVAPRQQHAQAQLAVSESPLSTGSSSSSTSLDFTSTESNTDLKQSSQTSSLASSLDSNKLNVVRRQQQQPPPQPQASGQAQRAPAGQNCQGAAGDHRLEGLGGVAAAAEKSLTSSSSKEAEAAGVTCYFHLSKSANKERGHEQLLSQMKSMKASDKSLQQISASRGVSITLGSSVESVLAGQSAASYRRKVVIHGPNWRSVMDSVNDLGQLYPDLMSQAVASFPGSGSKQVEPEHQPNSSKAARKQEAKPQQQQQPQLQSTPPQQAPPPQLQQKPSAAAHQGASANSAKPQALQHQAASVKPTLPQPPPQPLPPPPPPHPPAPHTASAAAAASPGTGTPVAASSANPSVSKASGRPAKMAQNVRFQLTTPQRESLFTQDEAGRPTNSRLKSLLSSLQMELIFLERSVNQDSVPSVKVRFFFENFDQLTAFCKAIDYQIPSQC